MKIDKKIFNDLRVYDTSELERLIHTVKDELNERLPYKNQQIAFIYERDVE